ncbi:MAG: efflux RND transporter periplasmic adaptor subunit [Proteobacteria bacterium]|nr:efflux RND transporter periplasmic adaptor subunit [Pseudomonadota bacterium]
MKKPLVLALGALFCTQALIKAAVPILPQTLSWADHGLFSIGVAHAEEAAVKYTCPMHPQIISDKPGKCPICGMDLVPMVGHSHEQSALQIQTGAPVVEVAAETIQKMGVRTEKVSKGVFSQAIRATGTVLANERARINLFSQVEGRVADLKYAVGDPVRKGDLFYTLYSPELLGLQNDYIAAVTGKLASLAQAARQRMKLLGLDDSVITHLSKTGKAYDQVPFYIPADGVLAKLEIRNGHYLKADDEIGYIQDLSSVWVEAEIAEKDVQKLKEGDSATVRITGNATSYNAKIDYIYPTITPEARTVKARLIVKNEDGRLKPAGYATVEFAAGAATEQLTVPSEAILRGSEGEHVIVALGGGKFQPRDVKTGSASNGRTQITSGLSEGEEVVTSAQFLIDSESNLRESLNKMSMPGMAMPEQSTPADAQNKDIGKGVDMPGMEMDHGR